MKNKILTALLSLVIAIGIWFYVVTVVSPNADKQYNSVPLVIQSETLLHERGLMITEMDISAVTLQLKGNRIDLNKLSSANIIVTLDVSRIYEAGTHKLQYSVTYPGDVAQNAVNTVKKTPDTVTIVVEERISKNIPVEVLYDGNVAEKFMADKENKVLDHNEVNITGPKSKIDQITKAQVRVDLEGRNESISEEFDYLLCNAQGEALDAQLITTNVEKVNLTLKIMRVKEIELTVKVVDGGGATVDNTDIMINPKTIWVSGSDTLLENLESLEIGIVELGTLLEDTDLTFAIVLPEGITDETGVSEATVSVDFPDLFTRTVTVKDISAINVPAGLEADLLTKALEIQVRGPKDKVEDLDVSALKVTVDFSETELGAVKLKADLVSSDPAVGAVGTYTVSATVREKK